MIDSCYRNLNIDVSNALKNTWRDSCTTFHKSGNYGEWQPLADRVFNKEWLEYMKSIGLPIFNCMIFYRGPYSHTNGAHIDVSRAKPFTVRHFGINWCVGGHGSEMVWYKLPDDAEKRVEVTAANSTYVSWPFNSLKEVERHHIGNKVTLVKTGVPHAIIMKAEPRWCFSARTSIPDNFTWEKAIELFRSKNLLIENI
jgi:hypothetical protein